MMRCREAKEFLTHHPEAPITARLTSGELVDLRIEVGYLCRDYPDSCFQDRAAGEKALRDAGLRPEDVKGVVMVGGATRMPQGAKAVGDFFRQEPLTNLDPDKVVALGPPPRPTCWWAIKPARTTGFCSTSFHFPSAWRPWGLTEKVIPRNSTIPLPARGTSPPSRMARPPWPSMSLQGERELVADCRSLARFELRGIPPMVAGAARIRVSFRSMPTDFSRFRRESRPMASRPASP